MELSKLTIDNLLSNEKALESTKHNTELLSKIRPKLYQSLGTLACVKMKSSVRGVEVGFGVDIDLDKVLDRVIATTEYMVGLSDHPNFIKLRNKLDELDVAALDMSDKEPIIDKFLKIEQEFVLSTEIDYIIALSMHDIVSSLNGTNEHAPKDTYIIK